MDVQTLKRSPGPLAELNMATEHAASTVDAVSAAAALLDQAIMIWIMRPDHKKLALHYSDLRHALEGAISGSFLLLDQRGLSPELLSALPSTVWQALESISLANGCAIDSICFPAGMTELPAECFRFGPLQYLELPAYAGTSNNLLLLPPSNCPLHLALKDTEAEVTILAWEHAWIRPSGHEHVHLQFFDESMKLSSRIAPRPSQDVLRNGLHGTYPDIYGPPFGDGGSIEQRIACLGTAIKKWLGPDSPVLVQAISDALRDAATASVLWLDESRLTPARLGSMPISVWIALRNLSLARDWKITHIIFPSEMKVLPSCLAGLFSLDYLSLPHFKGMEIDLRGLMAPDSVLHLALPGVQHRVSVKTDSPKKLITSGHEGSVTIVEDHGPHVGQRCIYSRASRQMNRKEHLSPALISKARKAEFNAQAARTRSDSKVDQSFSGQAVHAAPEKTAYQAIVCLQDALRTDNTSKITANLERLFSIWDRVDGMAQLLIDTLHRTDSDGMSALYRAFHKGHLDAVLRLPMKCWRRDCRPPRNLQCSNPISK